MGKTIEVYHEDPVLQTFMLFIQAAREITKYSDSRFFRGLHLSTVKYIALKALAMSGGMLTKSDLAIWTDTKRHNITTLVRRMEIEGLVTTGRDEKDKRFEQVTLTDKGRDLFVKANVVAYDLINRVMSGIGKRQVAQLDRILRFLKSNTQIASKE
jgi:DNA-binding MarR family transcriptional regulator